MLLFLWGFITIVFGIAYLFQILNLTLIGLELVAILLLFLSFWESKKGRYSRIIAMNIVMVFVIGVLYYSQHTFTYIQHHDTEKLLVIIGGFIISQVMGIFWGIQFYKQQKKSNKNKKS
ncbi:hypothetical protein [Lactococcus protaetiae]|uniref:Uncharacterized protein n=1 Tax=Lactococcus protaetiae TaxID=2592653 RepID=A0A514Z5R6_9LACT|nr:hypothetical protein [Lactococcus protaetiae]QDK69935.1 hypothetical protein FLP15_00575 [Lactococcus protaetiae]